MKRFGSCLIMSCFLMIGCSDDNDSKSNSDLDCKATNCDGVMVCVENNSQHCGACGHACESYQTCENSECVGEPDSNACKEGKEKCDDKCVDIKSDEANCAECGHACDENEICDNGSCKENTDPVCPGKICDNECVDVETDKDNCGDCGHACGKGMVCDKSACVCENADLIHCEGADACVDLKTDKANCGECGHACAEGEVCSDGACGCADKKLTKCDGQDACIDLTSDDANCGECGHACGEGFKCSDSVCVCADEKLTKCDGQDACVDLTSDIANCGECGHACGEGTKCSDSVCVCDDSALTYCDAVGKCLDLKTDNDHCGDCDTKCGDKVCLEGKCEHPGMVVINYARKFLYDDSTKMCTYDWYKEGSLKYFNDFYDVAGYNYGYDMNCANFVGAVLKGVGEVPTTERLGSVLNIRTMCENKQLGYRIVDAKNAQPGDIWYKQTSEGYSHAELIVGIEGDKFVQIGSNNFSSDKKPMPCQINHDNNPNYSADPKDYQAVTEHTRDISFGGVVCSKR